MSMRKTLLVAIMALFGGVATYGQTPTTVTATVVDPNGNAYANGTVSAVLISQLGVIPKAGTNNIVPSSGPFPTDSSGSFSIQLVDNLAITQPTGTQWQFKVCAATVNLGPQVTVGTVCTLSPLITVVAPGPQDVSVAINSTAAVLGPRLSSNFPGGNNGDLQAKTGVGLTPACINDSGLIISTCRPISLGKPIYNSSIVPITGTTPNVSTGNVFKLSQVSGVSVTNFLGGVDSQIIKINCIDANSTIVNNANIVTSTGANLPCGVNQPLEFTFDATQVKWLQTAGGGGGGTISGGGTAGRLAGFTGASAIGNVNLTGDCTTSGGLATTCGPPSTGIIPTNRGGTGTASPAPVAGANMQITGTFPNQTYTSLPFPVVQSGLMAEYRILPSETVGSLVDYSGNGNGATGTVGTSPTIIANTGGIQCNANGAVSLPSGLNSALTVMAFVGFQPSATTLNSATPPSTISQAIVSGNDATKHAIAMELFTRQIDTLVLITHFTPLPDGYRPTSEANDSASANLTWTEAAFTGVGSLTLAMDTSDTWYYNGVLIPNNNNASHTVAGQQTLGNYQICGAAAGSGQTAISYFQGQIYYLLFYNRVLTPAEVSANHNLIVQSMAARGVNISSSNVTTDTKPQIVALGDSITAGSPPSWVAYAGLPIVGMPVTPAAENQGIQNATALGRYPFANVDVDTLYRSGAIANVMTYWMGTNDGSSAVTNWGLARDYLALRRTKGFKVIPFSMISRTAGFDAFKDALNPLIRTTWNQYADGFCDIAANPNLGADGANANTTYFIVDGIHPNTFTDGSVIAPMVNACLARLYGNLDFSAARTVVAPTGIAFVAANTFNLSPFASVSIPGPTVTAGSSMLVFLRRDTPDYVSTSNGDTPVSVTSTSNGGSVWYFRNMHPGTLFINMYKAGLFSSGSAQGHYAIYTGISSYSPIETFSNNNAGSGTTMTGGAVTPNQNNSLIVGLGGTAFAASSIAGSAGYTLRTSSGAGSNWLVDLIQGAAAATTPTATNGTSLTNYGMTSVVLPPEVAGLVQLNDADVFVNANPAPANVTVMLPTAVGITGQRVNIKNIQTSGANTVTVVPKAFRILSVVGAAGTVTYTVDNTFSLTTGQTVTTSGCTTGGFNLTGTVASVPSTTTFTVTNATVATENEPVAAQFTNETIDGLLTSVIANSGVAIYQSVLTSNTLGGATWKRIQ